MSKILVIVESPTKARTIKKFLPKDFKVLASMGHVRDLPQSASDIPAKLKQEEWAKLGVNVENNFEPLYIIPKNKSKIIRELKDELKNATELYLATDEDREGESISWHLMQVLKPKVPVKRMIFHEITKSAITQALKDCRDVDTRLVQAQETRRILDRLVGYTLSPLIWKKIAYGLSAGRVQSSGLRLIVERERERIRFRKGIYWDLLASLEKDGSSLDSNTRGQAFDARLVEYSNQRVATGKDFDAATGKVKDQNLVLLGEEDSLKLEGQLKNQSWRVKSVEEKEQSLKPYAPFITSTLQQEANRKLGLSAKMSMRIAQSLYEQGFITYMRTDSMHLSNEGIEGARAAVTELYGKDYLYESVRVYKAKSKLAQEAHEAIRPAGSRFIHPNQTGLSGKELALYELIWKRTVATQMADAKKLSLSVRIEVGKALFAASGSRILFAGFLRAYVEGSDDPEAALGDREVILPELKAADPLNLKKIDAESHETKPPARYTEASLVQKLEKEGIGRPSTYASIIQTILDRGYVVKQAQALVPTFTGFAVVQFLERHFAELVDYGFTSQMEEALDEIAEGTRQHLPYLEAFYLGGKGLQKQTEQKEKSIDPETSRIVHLDQLSEDVRVGRFGPYVIKANKAGKKKDDIHASIPEDIAPADLDDSKLQEIIETAEKGPQSLGRFPDTGEAIYVMTGRFGPYVQLGEVTDANPKPKRASIPKGINPRELQIEEAIKFLTLPRDLGAHPETGKSVVTNNGRFGPYVVHEGDFRSLKKEDDVYTIDLRRALELLSEEKKGRGGAKVLREIGPHPKTKKMIAVYEGRYGPYIKHGRSNASLPKDQDVEKLTLQEALGLIGKKKG